MASFEVVNGEEAVEVGLDLLGVFVPGGASLDAEALIEQGPVHPLDKAVGSWRADLGGPMLDVLKGQEQLVVVLFRVSTELASVVGQHRSYGHSQGLVEGQDPVVEQVTGRDRHLGVVDLGEGQRAEGVDDDLDVDLADALQGAPVEGVLIQELSGS